MSQLPHFIRRSTLAAAAFMVMAGTQSPVFAEPPLPGAVFTAAAPASPGGPCTTVNSNIYDVKADVYLNGGPDRPNAAGLLPNTRYYVQVTDPGGATVLGSSLLNSGSQQPVQTDATGKFVLCYRLIDIVSYQQGQAGYNDTPNNGGEYKVWISTVADFSNNSTKTDNFKVYRDVAPPGGEGQITIRKFYDADTNGVQDAGEPDLPGWKVDLLGYPARSTLALYELLVDGTYVAREFMPLQLNWYATSVTVNGVAQANASSTPTILNAGNVTLVSPNRIEGAVVFGNVCTGAGGGKTLGFWSNKNGEAAMNGVGMGNALAMLSSLNLKSAAGADFNPATHAAFRSWLLGGNAVNMAYMLSVQLAAMEMNVYTGRVNGNSLIHALGTNSANALGFASVAAVMAEANFSLGNFGYTIAGVPQRTYQEYLKDALDNANNNRTFVQGSPCAFGFSNPVMAP